jgi:hypothetical protein
VLFCVCVCVCAQAGGGDFGNKNCKRPYQNMLEVLRKSGGWSVSRPTSEQRYPPDSQVTIMCDAATDLHEGSFLAALTLHMLKCDTVLTKHIYIYIYIYIDQDSSVGIAICYGPNGPGFESWWGEISSILPDWL